MGDTILEKANLGAEVRDAYRAQVRARLASGASVPLVAPYSLLAVFILPILYLSVPHARRPWLYAARFPLMAFIVAFSLHEIRAGAGTSENFAAAYAVGLCHAWAVVWSATLLIWMRPQFEAERVERRRTSARVAARTGQALAHGGGSALPGDDAATRESQRLQGAPDEDVARNLNNGYEYYWQAFPAEEPFLTRLGWATDLVLAFRGTGWNWCISVLPRFAKPEKPLSGELVKLDSMPLSTPAGYARCTTRKAFLRSRLRALATTYLILDVCSVVMMRDPYHVLGPTDHPLPPFLASLPPWLLTVGRCAADLVGTFYALRLTFTSYQVATCLVAGPALLDSVRGELWHHPTVNGSFAAVLDRGLAGFWGAWWHQTFRVAFAAPAGYLRLGASPAGRAAAVFLAFAVSCLLHAAGSHTLVGPSRPWMPPLFFLASWAGLVLQEWLGRAVFRRRIARLPRRWRRAGNLVFALAWLRWAAWPFLDDLARGGLWMYEPVPVSLLRAAGLGKPGDGWWRWDWAYVPYWRRGGHWWESGVAL